MSSAPLAPLPAPLPEPDPGTPAITRTALFLGFLQVGLTGFGGVLAAARRILVEDRRWLKGPEFTALLSIGQLLPGPNVINLSVALGDRFHGVVGSLIAIVGLMLAPMAIVLMLGWLYVTYGDVPFVQGIVRGIAPAAAGLMVATALKMAFAELRRPWRIAIALAGFAGVGLLRLPLFQVLPALVVIAIGLSWWTLRRQERRS